MHNIINNIHELDLMTSSGIASNFTRSKLSGLREENEKTIIESLKNMDYVSFSRKNSKKRSEII